MEHNSEGDRFKVYFTKEQWSRVFAKIDCDLVKEAIKQQPSLECCVVAEDSNPEPATSEPAPVASTATDPETPASDVDASNEEEKAEGGNAW